MEQEVALKEIPIDEIPLADYKKARAEGKTTVPEKVAAVEEETETVEPAKPKLKGGFQKRIDRMVKYQATLGEENEKLRKENEELKSRPNGNPAKNEPVVPVEGKPVRTQFQSEDEYFEAVADWKFDQKLKAKEEADRKTEIEAINKEKSDKFRSRMAELRSENENFKEIWEQANNITVPAFLNDVIVFDLPNGMDVAWYLANNPEECERLSKASSESECKAMAWKISEKLTESAKGAENTSEDEGEEEAVTEQPKPEKKTAPPIRPVTGGTTRSSVALDKMSLKDYKKARAAGRNH